MPRFMQETGSSCILSLMENFIETAEPKVLAIAVATALAFPVVVALLMFGWQIYG